VAPNGLQPPGQSVFRLRIQLADVRPVVWRRVLAPGSVRLSKLSEMLLAAMGWTNSHLHAFLVGDKRFGMNFDEFPEGEIDENGVTVLQALRDQRRFVFEYDFGDGWEHELVVEARTIAEDGKIYPACIAGQGACPPEDSGGVWGFEQLKEILAGPPGAERDEMREWAGDDYDPARFDLAAANGAVAAI
jgi:hypothetical protein